MEPEREWPYLFIFESLPEYMLIDFRERGREGEKRISEDHPWVASRRHPTGTEPATQVHAPIKNRTLGAGAMLESWGVQGGGGIKEENLGKLSYRNQQSIL